MKLFGIHVRVDMSFIIIVSLIGFDRLNQPALLVQWILVATFAVLAHELGHALVGRAYGLTPSIQLYGMGGLTSWSGGPRLTPARHIAVSLAGPFAGFFIAGLWYGAMRLVPSLSGPSYERLTSDIYWVTLGWGVLNLVPMLPLDGGNVVRSGLELVAGRPLERVALVISAVTSVVLAAAAFLYGLLLAGVFVLYFGWMNVSALFEGSREREDESARHLLQSAVAEIEKGRGASAIPLLAEVQQTAKARSTRQRAAEALVYAWLQANDVDAARKALGAYSAVYGEHPYLAGLIALEAGEPERAVASLEELFNARVDPRIGQALCRAYVRTGRDEKALAVCSSPAVARFAPALYATVAEEAYRLGRFEVAADAGAKSFELANDPMQAYNVACSLARAGRSDEAVQWLGRALDAGFVDAALLESDADLDSLRDRSDFARLGSRVGAH